MINLPKPTDEHGNQYIPQSVYELCISHVRDNELGQRFQSIIGNVSAAAEEYNHAGDANDFTSIHQADSIEGRVSRQEMESVYTLRMAKKSSRGRSVYDRILSLSPHGKCPLCNVGSATTLDHQLPKRYYPALAVTPNNLVPACKDCQQAKGDCFPSRIEEQPFHPYFDKVDNVIWLQAKVIEESPAIFEFYVSQPPEWDNIMFERAKQHLSLYNLYKTYTTYAAEEMINIRGRLRDMLSNSDSDKIKEHLLEEANSRSLNYKNSWQTATYYAAANSDWFCAGGFEA